MKRLSAILQSYARGDFSEEISVPENENKLAELQASLKFMVDRFKEMLQERDALITERKQTEESLRLLSSAVEQSTEGVAISDLGGNLLFVNNAFATMHGYTPEEIAGKHLSIFHTHEQMPSVDAANRKMQETGKFGGEIWHVRRDGTVFPALMHNSLLRDEAGDPIGMIGTLRDITERKHAEEALRESEERLLIAGKASYDLIYEWNVKRDSLEWFGDIDSLLGFNQGEISRDIQAWLD